MDPDIKNLSKRKLKLSRTKRTLAEVSCLGQKLIFDDDGNPHELYEIVNSGEFYRHGSEAVKRLVEHLLKTRKGN